MPYQRLFESVVRFVPKNPFLSLIATVCVIATIAGFLVFLLPHTPSVGFLTFLGRTKENKEPVPVFTCDADTIALWQLDSPGDILRDTCGKYPGVIRGTTLVPALFGMGREFIGSREGRQGIDSVTADVSVAAQEIKTIEVWVKFAALTDGQEIVGKSAFNRGIELVLWEGALRFYVMGSSNSNIGVPYERLNTTDFFSIAATQEGPGGAMQLYVNGEKLADGTAPTSIGDAPKASIGTWNDPINPRPFQGIIDEVRFSKTVRTPADIMNIYRYRPL